MNTKSCTKTAWIGSLFSLGALLLTGCAGVRPTLKPEQVATVNRTEVRAYLPYKGIKAEFVASSYGAGGGLVGALVDSAVTSSHQRIANERVQRLRNAVADLDIAAMHWQALSNELYSIPWLKLQSFATFPLITPGRIEAKDVASGAAMHVGSDFVLSQDCQVFRMDTGMGFVCPNRKGNAGVIVSYHSAQIGDCAGDKAIDLWTTNGAAAFRKMVTEAVEQNAKLVRHALELMGNTSTTVQKPAKVKVKLVHAAGDFGIPVGKAGLKGTVLEDTPDRLVFRVSATGAILSLPRSEVELQYLPAK